MDIRIIYYFRSIGIFSYRDQVRLFNMFIEDSEDYLWIQIYDRLIPITKSQYVLKRWNEFTNYIEKNKELYIKYLKDDKNKNNSC